MTIYYLFCGVMAYEGFSEFRESPIRGLFFIASAVTFYVEAQGRWETKRNGSRLASTRRVTGIKVNTLSPAL